MPKYPNPPFSRAVRNFCALHSLTLRQDLSEPTWRAAWRVTYDDGRFLCLVWSDQQDPLDAIQYHYQLQRARRYNK